MYMQVQMQMQNSTVQYSTVSTNNILHLHGNNHSKIIVTTTLYYIILYHFISFIFRRICEYKL